MQLPVDGATLNYEVDGAEGSPAVLLWHGAGCTLRMWDHVVARIADRFRVVRFDVRGVGGSSPTEDPDSQYRLEQYADDAGAILEACGVSACHVWSMAWGSRAALAFCVLKAERVLSAALYDASIARADVAAQREGSKAAVAKQVAAGVERFAAPPGWNSHETPIEVPKAMAAAGRFDLVGASSRLTAPLLVVTGDHDPNLASSRDLVARVPGARLVVLENVGHGSVLQRPDLTTDAFIDFQSSLQ